MQKLIIFLIAGGFLTIGGCASTAETPEEGIRFHTSDRAEKLIEEQGKTLAAIRGYDRDSPLVCERFQKTGSHISYNVCYTREEMERRRLNHQENSRYFSTPGAKCFEGSGGGGGPGEVRGARGQC